MRTLNENQKKATLKLGELKVGALYMGCGCGKTLAACELVNSVEGVDYLLWVCPCGTVDNLRREIDLCGLRYAPDIVGIESIGQSERIYVETRQKLQKAKRAFIVCDESIKIKNIRAIRTRRMMTLSRYAEYKLVLNGTPVTKGLTDIYPQMEFLSPRILNMRYPQFCDTFCNYRGVRRGGRVVKRVITGYTNIDYLMSVIKPYVYQCDLNLPLSRSYADRYYYLTEEENREYEDIKMELFTLDEFGDNRFLGTVQKMQHSYCCSEEKFKLLENLVGDRTIVYCKFIRSQQEVERRFPGLKVLTYGKNSFGLNLQEYNRIVYFDKTFDYAFREQSEARIYRTGQQNDCEYFDLTGDVGLESLIDRCISSKTNLVSYLKKHGKKAIEEL